MRHVTAASLISLVAVVLAGCEAAFEGDEPGECGDGADNDRDGAFDCDDEDCAGAPTCGADDDATPADDDTAPDDDSAPDDDTTSGEECTVFPADNPWNTDVSAYPVHPQSATWIARMFENGTLFPGFGTVWEGEPIGIPTNEVAEDTPFEDFEFLYADESDPGPYPASRDMRIEGSWESDGDRHVLAIDRDACMLYELYWTWPPGEGENPFLDTWYAGSGAVFDLRSNDLRPDYWTSADAAGLPIYPGLVRYEEMVEEGEIRHAVRITVHDTQRAFIHPATHYACHECTPDLPPMGLRVRLKADHDTSGYSPEVRVLLQALKTYGMLIADNGGDHVFITGVPDDRWNEDHIHEFTDIPASAFEAVDTGPLIYPE